MAGNKTLDGIKLTNILKFATAIGVEFELGRKHHYKLQFCGYRPCPVGTSTNARTMIVPWLKHITNYNAQTLYNGMRRGRLN